MAASPQFKVYDPEGNYEAACHGVETAAVIVAFLGKGAKIRWQHKYTVWCEGDEPQPASESYDYVATRVHDRISRRHRVSFDQVYNPPPLPHI